MNKMLRALLSLMLCTLVMLSVCMLWSCEGGDYTTTTTATASTTAATTTTTTAVNKNDKYVSITFEGYGTLVMELDYDNAPLTCANFAQLVREGFYDGLTMHRIVDLTGYNGWIVQGGDPDGDGSGGSDRNVVGEFAANGYTNDLSHVRGTVSMARARNYNSATSQFFICVGNCTYLNGSYAAFATVISGIEAVDAMVQDYSAGTLTAPPVITSAEITDTP